ncbi:MAG: ABC transporter ATP-binding protein [Betaproteobacteria bacterium]|nr:ABC transporter ATP-binding protein [Betaproteobacteria bacterium]
MTALLELRHVSKGFGGVLALDDVSFSIAPKELVGLIGPNGAGKTTVFNLVSGVHALSQGEVIHRGERVSGASPTHIARRGIARTFQNIRLFRSLTVMDHVLVAQTCRSRGLLTQFSPFATRAERERRRTALQALEAVGLAHRRDEPAVHLPYGGQRRLEIARALATSPEILLLDEPAAGLNDTETGELRRLLDTLRQRGYTIVLVEHDMKLVMRLCSRILVLNFGRLIASGTPQEVRANGEVIDAYLGVVN